MLKRKYNLLGIIVLAVLCSNIVLGFGHAAPNTVITSSPNDKDGDGISNQLEQINSRVTDVQTRSNETIIESRLTNSPDLNQFQIRIGYNPNGLSVKVSYESNYQGEYDFNGTQCDLQFSVNFNRLIEFVDLNGDKKYEPSIDQTVQIVQLNSWKLVNYTKMLIAGNSYMHKITISTSDNVLQVIFFITEQFNKINNTLITPTETKFNIEIRNFGFMNSSSQLALDTTLKSENQYQYENQTQDELKGYASDEKGVATTSGHGYIGFFTWGNTAQVDGVQKNITVSSIKMGDDNQSQELYLNYPHGTIIIHDPKIGIANALVLVPSLLPLFNSIIIIGVMGVMTVSIIYLLRRRHKRINVKN